MHQEGLPYENAGVCFFRNACAGTAFFLLCLTFLETLSYMTFSIADPLGRPSVVVGTTVELIVVVAICV